MRIPQKMTFSEAEQESGQQFGRDPCSLTNMRQNIAFLKKKKCICWRKCADYMAWHI